MKLKFYQILIVALCVVNFACKDDKADDSNKAPVAGDVTFTIADSVSVGTLVGTVTASDADGNTLVYSISAGNTAGTFAINSANGAITVNALLDAALVPQYVLTVNVSDGKLADNATITINVTHSEGGYTYYSPTQFCMGVDLSYANQIEDHGGVFRDSGEVRDVFQIMTGHGANVVRVRLWNYPIWTQTIYGNAGTQMYSDLADVEKTIRRAKVAGSQVCLDFHYSDTWTDPGKSYVPAAWSNITSIGVLKDSVYNYTLQVLQYLDSKDLLPEMVQIGNEINQGFYFSDKPANLPDLNAYTKHWSNIGIFINSAISAVRSVSPDILVILHVADPNNVQWWFDEVIANAGVTDFDIVGFSYYPLWHTTIPFSNLSTTINGFKSRYNRKVMIMETAYPWTTDNADSNGNLFYSQTPVSGYPYTKEGQKAFLKDLTQAVIAGGGSGIFYWEPDWITCQMVDLWNSGSCFDNATFFDFTGNTLESIDYMRSNYEFK